VSNRLLILSERIQSEVVNLESVIDRIKEGWQRSKKSGDDYYIDSVALNLHGFYSGLERISQPPGFTAFQHPSLFDDFRQSLQRIHPIQAFDRFGLFFVL
jgi:hypothetical protein